MQFATQMFRELLDPLELLDQILREYALVYLLNIRRNRSRQRSKLICLLSQRDGINRRPRKIPLITRLQFLSVSHARLNRLSLGKAEEPEEKNYSQSNQGDFHAAS